MVKIFLCRRPFKILFEDVHWQTKGVVGCSFFGQGSSWLNAYCCVVDFNTKSGACLVVCCLRALALLSFIYQLRNPGLIFCITYLHGASRPGRWQTDNLLIPLTCTQHKWSKTEEIPLTCQCKAWPLAFRTDLWIKEMCSRLICEMDLG